jgi:hypothetical protein
MDRLKEIADRLKAATPGEWNWEGDLLLTSDTQYHVVLKPFYDDDTYKISTCVFDNDKEFIAHSKTDIPYLLTRLHEAEAELKILREDSAELALTKSRLHEVEAERDKAKRETLDAWDKGYDRGLEDGESGTRR